VVVMVVVLVLVGVVWGAMNISALAPQTGSVT